MSLQIRPACITDLPEILTTIFTSARADGILEFPGKEEILEHYSDSLPNAETDIWVAFDDQEGVIAVGDGIFREEVLTGIYSTRTYVHPNYRGRGAEQLILNCQLDRYSSFVARYPKKKISIVARAQANQKNWIDLLKSNQFRTVRLFFELEYPLSRTAPSLELSEGFRSEIWQNTRNDLKVWAAMNTSFQGHWGYQFDTFETFSNRIQTRQIDPDYSLLIWKNEELAAASLNMMGEASRLRFHQNIGWISYLFVVPEMRRLGLGSFLITQTVAIAQKAGHASLGLFVDSGNRSGAIQLYEKSGFHLRETLAIFQRD